jgi:transposase
LARFEETKRAIERANELIRKYMASCSELFINQACEILDVISGIGRDIAEAVIAEIGVDMTVCPTGAHIAGWAGMCSGNRESAGKHKHEKMGKGNPYLRGALTQAAWAAFHSKKSYLSSQYHRLARRLGNKRALVAVAHSILVIIYHMLSKRIAYQDLGADYIDQRRQEALRKRLVHKLETLDFVETIQELPKAA